MPDNDKSPTAALEAQVGELQKTIDGKLSSTATKADLDSLNTKLAGLTDDLKTVKAEIKTKDNELDAPILGVFKTPADFWMTGMCLLGARGPMSREQAHKKLYGDGGYEARVRAHLEKSATGFSEALEGDLFLMPQIAAG